MVPRILVLREEVGAALLHPVRPRRLADLVRRRQQRTVAGEGLDRRVLVGHAVRADLRRVGPVLRVVELEFVVLDDHGAAVEDVLQQPAVVRTQIVAPLVRAHAGHDAGEAREVAPGEILGGEQLYLCAELLDRRRHLIADAHHVADQQVRGRPNVDHFQRRVRFVVNVVPLDVRVLDHLKAAGVRLAA